MKLRWFADQGQPAPGPAKISFDFIVAPHATYIPGSGPALAPITRMPPHDKDGFIIDKVQFKKQLRYLVGYEQYPQLKVSIQPQNILDWISPYALEDWEAKHYDAEEKRRKEEELPALLAKDERRRKRLEALSRAATGIDGRKIKRKGPTDESSYGRSGRSAKSGRSRRNLRASHRGDPSRRDQPDEAMIYTSPKQSQRSQQSQQPSLSTPTRKYAGIDTDLDSNGEGSIDTDTAIQLQLGIDDTVPSRSTSESADMLGIQTKSASASNAADSSGGELQDRRLFTPRRCSGVLPGVSAVAATSSREALKIYEGIERKKKASVTPLISNTTSPPNQKHAVSSPYNCSLPNTGGSKPVLAASQSKTVPKVFQPDLGQEDMDNDSEESEYELNEIVDDDVRYENGKKLQYYLIDWVGDYANTWEPAENVSHGAIAEYKERIKKKRKAVRMSGSAEREMDREYMPKRQRNGVSSSGQETLKRARGHVVDDDNATD